MSVKVTAYRINLIRKIHARFGTGSFMFREMNLTRPDLWKIKEARLICPVKKMNKSNLTLWKISDFGLGVVEHGMKYDLHIAEAEA